MAITAQLVKELREKTGAGMMDCKKALTETDGDMEKAIEYLREKGIAKAAKKADRVAAEGLTAIKIDGEHGVLIEVNSETDFVAKNENFIQFTDAIASHVLAAKPADLDAALASTMNGKSLAEFINENIAKIGENLNLRRFVILPNPENGVLGHYLHMGGRIGVLVSIAGTTDEELAKDIAMHIAATNPRYISHDEVPADVIEKEREILTQQALNEGKPAKIVEKMVEGRIHKFFEEICLVDQAFVKDPDKSIAKLLKEHSDASVLKFARFEVGEGIEKKEENFAEEVMSQVNK